MRSLILVVCCFCLVSMKDAGQLSDPAAKSAYDSLLARAKTLAGTVVVSNGSNITEAYGNNVLKPRGEGEYMFYIIGPAEIENIKIDIYNKWKGDSDFKRYSGIVTNPNGSKGYFVRFRLNAKAAEDFLKIEWETKGLSRKSYIYYVFIKV